MKDHFTIGLSLEDMLFFKEPSQRDVVVDLSIDRENHSPVLVR
jgi:hypothetical protein